MRTVTKLFSFLLAVVMLCGVMPYGVVEAATATITEADVINRANALTGTTYPAGYCMGFVSDFFAWFGATRSGACCAYTYGNRVICSTDKNAIPIGADVFFDNTGDAPSATHRQNNGCTAPVYGHVGIYIGDGNFIHVPSSGIVTVTSLSNSYWGSRFRGWGYHENIVIKDATGLDAKTPVDVGTGFTALIINVNAWKLIESDTQNSELPHVRINDETGKANQLWYFDRQSDGSYKISSCYDGEYLDVYCALTDLGTPIQTCWDTGSDAQRWYIYDENGVYVFRSKFSGQVMDLKNNDSTNGNILQTYDWNQSTAQIWAIYRSEDTELKGPELTVHAGDDKTKTIFSWTSVYGAKEYALYIHKNQIGSGEFIPYKAGSATSAELDLPAGTYQAYVDSEHAYDYQMGNVVTFTVSEHSCTYTSEETEPTCTTAGSIIYTCTACGDSYEEIIPAKVHTYVPETNSQITATCEKDGWVKYNCIYCSDSYTETIPATGHNYENNVCTSCGDVLVVDYGVELHVSDVQATAGETVTVDIVLDKNVGFTYLNLLLGYDADAMELISVSNGTIVNSLTQGRSYIWAQADNATETGVLATLTFAVKEDVSAGDYAVTAEVIECCNENEQDVAVLVQNGTATVIDFVHGDCNGDGKVDGKDATRLLRYLASYDPTTGDASVEISLGADANGDGEINGKDATRLLRYLASYDSATGESDVTLG